MKEEICPECGANLKVWKEMMHEDHYCATGARARRGLPPLFVVTKDKPQYLGTKDELLKQKAIAC